jgi:hypothetical protein
MNNSESNDQKTHMETHDNHIFDARHNIEIPPHMECEILSNTRFTKRTTHIW